MKGDVAEEVSRLKAQPGQNMLIYGSGKLVRTLLRHGLIDEYHLWVHPTVLGRGKRLFGEGDQAALKLVGTQRFSTGVLVLSYEPDGTQR